jgi:asparagine synthase (glutamine-hydrolysing)
VLSRAVADVPLGAFLSGGVDSSAVVAILSRASSRRVNTFSVDFPAGDGGEGRYARMVADRYGTDHHELLLRPDMAAILPDLVPRYGEPFADPSAVPTYYVSKLARQHVTVSLSGDGGDEGFAGYTRYGIQEAARRLSALPGPLPRGVNEALRRLPGAALRPLREFAAHAGLPEAERYLFLLAHFTHRDKQRLAGPVLREQMQRDGRDRSARDFEQILAESDAADGINRLLDLDMQTYLPDDIFTKVDIASMAHSLEVRAPLVDHLLLERMAQFPGDMKMRAFRGKQLLRRAVADLLPAPILSRRKKGFGLPLGRWLREDLRDMSRDVLTDATAAGRGLFLPAEVGRLLDEHQAGVDHGERLWNLTVLELWLRHNERLRSAGRIAGR